MLIILRLSNCLEIENPPATLKSWLEGFCNFRTSSFSNGEDIPEILSLFEEDGNKIRVPRGLTYLVQEELTRLKLTYKWEDLTAKPTHYDFKINSNVKYKDGVFGYQKRVVDELKNFHTVRLEALAGSGKTSISCLLTGELQEGPILFLVNRDRLLKQFINTVVKVLDIPEEDIGIIKAKKYTVKPITVGSLQTLGKDSFNLEKIKYSFTTVFFDECHLSSALTYRKVLLGLAPRKLIGLSATPEHYFSEDLNNLMLGLLGPVGVRVEESDIPSRLVPECYTRETGLIYQYRADKKSPEWMKNKCRHKLFNDIANDKDRNRMIFKDCNILLKNKHKILVAVSRVSHGEILYNAFIKAGIKASFPYKGKNDESYTVNHKQLNEDCLKVETGEIDLLIGTYGLFQTGFDCRDLSAIIFASPFSGINSTAIIQSVGRVLRHTFDKDSAIVIDYIDDAKPFNLTRQWGEDRALVLQELSKGNHTFLKK